MLGTRHIQGDRRQQVNSPAVVGAPIIQMCLKFRAASVLPVVVKNTGLRISFLGLDPGSATLPAM